jgi:hypothetical protein
MKIRGVFDQHSEAVEHVKRLIKLDPTFDIYICDLYNWCLVPPDPEHITDQNYQNETLNTIISEYNKNQIYAKEHFEERKRELMAQAADEARQAALKKIQEESERQLEEEISELRTNECHILSQNNVTEIVDVTEIKAIDNEQGVGASEIFNEMILR